MKAYIYPKVAIFGTLYATILEYPIQVFSKEVGPSWSLGPASPKMKKPPRSTLGRFFLARQSGGDWGTVVLA